MRDEIADIVWLHKDYDEGRAAADAIMVLVLSDVDGLLLLLNEVTSAALEGTNK
jgi:hypothetical protein